MPAGRLNAVIAAADRLQSLIRARGDHAHVSVRPRASHLLVEVETLDGQRELVARATSLGGADYGLSFRTHAGRWEPLPVVGTIETVAEGLTTVLGPYLSRHNL